MANYILNAVNLGSFNLGETDKILTMFSSERGLVRAVAKGARKPGAKIAGRADVLNANKLLLAKGRNLDIITQAESIASFPNLRKDLDRLSYGFYYAELTQAFGQDLSDVSIDYFAFLCRSLSDLADTDEDPILLCLRFEWHLLEVLGIKPQIDFCVSCREPLTEYRVSFFDHDLSGIVCQSCFSGANRASVAEQLIFEYGEGAQDNPALKGRFKAPYARSAGMHITPLVWKCLVLQAKGYATERQAFAGQKTSILQAQNTCRCILQGYLEHKAGRRMRALDLLADG